MTAESAGSGSATTDGKPYSGDAVSLTSTSASAFTGTFASAGPGNGIVVKVTGNSLSGTQASDYVLSATDEENGAVTANITAASVKPSVASVSPSWGTINGGTPVTINGSGLTGATAVMFGTTPAASFTVVSDSEITAVTKAHTAGTVDVQVKTGIGTSATSTLDHFLYTPASKLLFVQGPTSGVTNVAMSPAVTIEVAQSNNGAVAAPGVTITLSIYTSPGGSLLTSVLGTTGSTGRATFSTIDISSAGTYTMTASATSLTSATSGKFTEQAKPVVTSISPTWGTISGGTTVTINGVNLSAVTAVKFGTTPATSFSVVNNTQITAVAPPHAAGLVDVLVSTPTLSSATGAADHFLYTKLVFAHGPSNGVANVAMLPVVIVQIPGLANIPVTLTISTYPGGAPVMTLTAVTNAAGIAVFNNIKISTPGTYSLTATATGLTAISAGPFTIQAGVFSLGR